jgi:hypothetical protein
MARSLKSVKKRSLSVTQGSIPRSLKNFSRGTKMAFRDWAAPISAEDKSQYLHTNIKPFTQQTTL